VTDKNITAATYQEEEKIKIRYESFGKNAVVLAFQSMTMKKIAKFNLQNF
jgi:hypothetical protein